MNEPTHSLSAMITIHNMTTDGIFGQPISTQQYWRLPADLVMSFVYHGRRAWGNKGPILGFCQ